MKLGSSRELCFVKYVDLSYFNIKVSKLSVFVSAPQREEKRKREKRREEREGGVGQLFGFQKEGSVAKALVLLTQYMSITLFIYFT